MSPESFYVTSATPVSGFREGPSRRWTVLDQVEIKEHRGGFARAVLAVLLMLGCGLVATGTASAQCWCGDGLTPVFGCCGGEGQRICVVDEWWNASNCPAECMPGLSLRWGACRAACPFGENLGICCGDTAQLPCVTSPHCAPGLSVADPTLYDPRFLLNCVPAALPEVTPPNGSAARPFYVIGHNPNTLAKVDSDLAAGANSLEPDITVAVDGPCPGTHDATIADLVDEDSSSPYRGGNCSDTHFEDWLDHVKMKALESGSKLAMIGFDIKSSAVDAARVKKILDAIRSHLTMNVPTLNVILSVGSIDDAKKAFGTGTETNWQGIRPGDLRANEGVTIDGETDPVAVSNFFITGSNSYSRFGYGYGTSLNAADVSFSSNQTRALDYGAFLKASRGEPKIIPWTYLINAKKEMDAFINAGVDGIIPGTITSVAPVPDLNCVAYYVALGITNLTPVQFGQYTLCNTFASPNGDADLDVSEIQNLVGVVNSHPEIRLATRDDNPFQPKLQSYGLEVTTPSGAGNGTDANLQFTLAGCKGTATMTVNTGHIIPLVYSTGRMESGQTDHVTIPSADLGTLASITIYNDGTGLGPDWTFQDIKISSAGFIGSDASQTMEYQGLGSHSLAAFDSITVPLKANFSGGGTFSAPNLPDVVAQCSATLPVAPVATESCSATQIVGTADKTGPFGQGDTTITWSFKDSAGNIKTRTQAVHVHDTIPPVISCPANIVVDATAPTGTVVPFTVTATDNCHVASLTSTPASGSIFPIGTTTVNNQARDIALPTGNLSTCNFTVHVKSAAEQLPELLASVTGVDPGKSLASKVQVALNYVQIGDTADACSTLADFMSEVKAQSGKKLTVAQANSLLAVAARIRAVLGC
jgi:hypothetical protein